MMPRRRPGLRQGRPVGHHARTARAADARGTRGRLAGRPVVIPDVAEVKAAVGRLERLLNRIEADREERRMLGQIPDTAVSIRSSAIRRVSATVSATSDEPTAQPVAPDARTKLMPLQWVVLEAADLADLAGAVAGWNEPAGPSGQTRR